VDPRSSSRTVEDTGFNNERFRRSRDLDERKGKWSNAKRQKELAVFFQGHFVPLRRATSPGATERLSRVGREPVSGHRSGTSEGGRLLKRADDNSLELPSKFYETERVLACRHPPGFVRANYVFSRAGCSKVFS
jgi:hypothetical protein